MINIAICDDDKVILSEIKNLLLNIAEKNFIKIDVNTYYDGSSLEKDINKGEVFDLYCLEHTGFATFIGNTKNGTELLVEVSNAYGRQTKVFHVIETWI